MLLCKKNVNQYEKGLQIRSHHRQIKSCVFLRQIGTWRERERGEGKENELAGKETSLPHSAV